MPTIRELRKAKKWTQQQLADRARIGRTTLYRMEKGLQVPNRATLDAIARALAVDSAEITGVKVLDRGKPG